MPEKLTKQQQKAIDVGVKKQLKKAEKAHQKEVDSEVKKQVEKSEKVLEKKIEAKLYKRFLRKSKAITAATAKRGLRTTVFIGHKFRDHASTAIAFCCCLVNFSGIFVVFVCVGSF